VFRQRISSVLRKITVSNDREYLLYDKSAVLSRLPILAKTMLAFLPGGSLQAEDTSVTREPSRNYFLGRGCPYCIEPHSCRKQPSEVSYHIDTVIAISQAI
jgi:hypothetical protein